MGNRACMCHSRMYGAVFGQKFYGIGQAGQVEVVSDNQPNNTIKIDVIQGTIRTGVEKLAPLPLERTTTSGLCHRDGTISMGRFAPDSAQADFFICIGDQPELDFGGLRNPDGQGFAAFGQVIEGMDVVRVIHRQPQHEQQFTPAIPIIQIDEEVIAR